MAHNDKENWKVHFQWRWMLEACNFIFTLHAFLRNWSSKKKSHSLMKKILSRQMLACWQASCHSVNIVDSRIIQRHCKNLWNYNVKKKSFHRMFLHVNSSWFFIWTYIVGHTRSLKCRKTKKRKTNKGNAKK